MKLIPSNMKKPTLLLFFWLAGLSLVIAKDLIVDADLTSPADDSYPSLALAVTSLVNASGFLVDSTNTITLLASTLTVAQTFPDHIVRGTGVESLLIQYESTPDAITHASNCSLLPTVVLYSNSYIDIPLLKNLTIVGLNILYQGSTSYNKIYNSTHVMFSRFCFNNSDPSYASPTADIPSTYYSQILIQSVTNVTITNGVYLWDGLKMFTIYESNVTLSSIVFDPLSTMHDKLSAAFQIYSASTAINVNIFQTQISCDSKVVLPMIIYVGYFNSLTMSGFNVENCDFNGYGDKSISLTTLYGGFKASLDDFTFTNVTFGNNSDQVLIYLNGVKNMSVSNFQISQLKQVAMEYSFSAFLNVRDAVPLSVFYPMEMYFTNFTFDNYQLKSYNRGINIYLENSQNYGLIKMQNISVSNSNIVWYCRFFSIGYAAPTVNTILNYFPTIVLDSITFDGVSIQSSDIFYIAYDIGQKTNINCEELFHIQISNARLENITFYESEFVQSDGYLISVSDLIASNITLNVSSRLFLSSNTLSTFFLMDSQLKNITLSDHSGIAISNVTTARDLKLEACYTNNNVSIFAETRPFIIYNTTFTNISAHSKSIFFSSTNPMVIIQNNTFSQTTLNHSNLFEVGGYLYFLDIKSYFIEWWNNGRGYYPLPGARGVQIFETVENSIFREHFDLQLLYNSIRESIEAYEPDNAIFFLNIQDNLIETLQSIENYGLILLKNFQIDYGTVFVKNNTFMSLTSDVDVNLFAGTTIERLLAVNNALAETSLPGYLLSLSASYLENLVIDSNHLTNTEKIGNFLVTAQECVKILIHNTVAVNNHAENPFVSISCDLIDSQVEFLNSRFENIVQNSTTGVLATLNVISITTKTKSLNGRSQISLKNNTFKNITVNGGEPFTTEILESSFIFMLAIDSTLILESNTFDEISITPSGNIFTLSIPTIYFANTTFSNFQFLDPNGAFNMLFYNLSIMNCSFESNVGLASTGVGLMKFTNPAPKNPSTILNVFIKNCTFKTNIGPFGALLYTKNTPIQLNINSTSFLNNYVNSSGGLLELYEISLSNVEASNSIFEATSGYLQDYPQFQVFSFQNPGQNVSLNIKDSLMIVGDKVAGTFVHVANQQSVKLTITNLTLTSAATTSTGTLSQFSILAADNVVASLTNINVSNLSISQVGLFILNCNMAKNISHIWNLKILSSSFIGLSLTQGIITINSDESWKIALDNLTVLVQNSTFRDIDWSSNARGIITSATSLVGKTDSNEFAITVSHCTFQNLKGVEGLIYHGVESKFDYVLWLDQSTFELVEASGRGALINPSSTLLSEVSINPTLQTDSATFQITNCSMRDIIAHTGAIFSWESQTRGITLVVEDNEFENIVANLHGGIFFGMFEISNAEQVLLENTGNALMISIKNSFYKNISAQNGAIVCFVGAAQLLDLTIEGCTFESLNSSQNGGVDGEIVDKFQTTTLPDQDVTARGALTDRSNNVNKKKQEPYDPNLLATWQKKFEKFRQKHLSKSPTARVPINKHATQEKRSKSPPKKEKANPRADDENPKKIQSKRKFLTPLLPVDTSNKMQEAIDSERSRQETLRQKIKELAKIEEAMIERLRASQSLEIKAKETVNRLSAMKISREDIEKGNVKELIDFKIQN